MSIQRSGRHQRPQMARLQGPLRAQAMLPRQAPMVRRYGLLAQALGEVARQTFGQAARVDEDQRRAMLFDQRFQPVVDFLPDLVGHDRR
jgi:hypothetical protein